MKKTITTILCCITLFACKNKSTTQIGEIHSNDEKSIKIAEFLKAYEAKDTATLTSMIDANKLIYITGKDTLNNKKWIGAIRENWMGIDSISFGSPEILTYTIIGKDTITDVKSLFKASQPYKFIGDIIHYNEPVHFTFKWNSSKIVEILDDKQLQSLIRGNVSTIEYQKSYRGK